MEIDPVTKDLVCGGDGHVDGLHAIENDVADVGHILGGVGVAEIVGEEPSVGRAGRAFDRWTAYLRSCVEDEQRNDRMMRRIYLGEATVGTADEIGVANRETV